MFRRSCRQITLALMWALAAGAAGAQGLAEYLGSVTWADADPAFGGFSGIEVAADGLEFLALSDRATVWRGRILRDADGRMTGAMALGHDALRDADGKLLTGYLTDAEGLATAPDGGIYVSFEGLARVVHYPHPDAASQPLPRADAFREMQSNASLEALAIGPDGALYTMPERPGVLAARFPVYRYRDGAWGQPFTVPRDGGWQAVGADFGPDGRFYLLERDYWGLVGFLSRVRRFDLTEAGFAGETLLLQTRVRMHDNLEGISVWRDGAGDIRLTLIADNNFRLFQSNEIAEYRVKD
ncbi:MAG: esterase-like activity of phytase family protein [Rhodobacteraceae bacterium]|nr:esterase-like activity of phytase family protein [Paracoccaceae bacterium]